MFAVLPTFRRFLFFRSSGRSVYPVTTVTTANINLVVQIPGQKELLYLTVIQKYLLFRVASGF